MDDKLKFHCISFTLYDIVLLLTLMKQYLLQWMEHA